MTLPQNSTGACDLTKIADAYKAGRNAYAECVLDPLLVPSNPYDGSFQNAEWNAWEDGYVDALKYADGSWRRLKRWRKKTV